MPNRQGSENWNPLSIPNNWNPNIVASLQSKYSLLSLDPINQSAYYVKLANASSFYIDSYGNVGINMINPKAQLSISSTNGACLRLYHKTINMECDLFLDSSGNLNIDTEGQKINITKSLNVSNILYLNDVAVTSTADQINYCDTVKGTAIANKALITDNQNNISDINSLTLISPLSETSGGTGKNSYSVGDILVANTTTTLVKLTVSSNKGDMLLSDPTLLNKIKWGPGILKNYINMATPIWYSPESYTINFLYAKNATNDIIIDNPTNIDSTNYAISSLLSGTVYPQINTSVINGLSTLFLTDFLVNDIITVIGNNISQSRLIRTIATDNQITVDIPFTMLNIWTLSTAVFSATQKKFGTNSLFVNNSTTQNIVFTKGADMVLNVNSWTIECFIFLSAINATRSIMSNTYVNIIFNSTGRVITVSLGNTGTTFNIVNAVSSTAALVASTWHHIAVVFTGTVYYLYVNGIRYTLATSSLLIPTNAIDTLRVGASGTVAYNGYIDEFRVSNIARYTTATITVPNVEFVSDVNTLSLQHFENINDTMSIDKYYPYQRGGIYGIAYLYAINTIPPSYVFSHRSPSNPLVDTLSTDSIYLNFCITQETNSGTEIRSIMNSPNEIIYYPYYNIVSNANNTTVATYNLLLSIPVNICSIKILITHAHTATTVSNIIIGDLVNTQSYLTMNSSGTSQIIAEVPITNEIPTIRAYISGASSTYSLSIIGFSIKK
jgi:hypothetical protein